MKVGEEGEREKKEDAGRVEGTVFEVVGEKAGGLWSGSEEPQGASEEPRGESEENSRTLREGPKGFQDVPRDLQTMSRAAHDTIYLFSIRTCCSAITNNGKRRSGVSATPIFVDPAFLKPFCCKVIFEIMLSPIISETNTCLGLGNGDPRFSTSHQIISVLLITFGGNHFRS